MKTKIATVVVTMANLCGFAQDAVFTQKNDYVPPNVDVTLTYAETKLPRNGVVYYRMEAVPMASVGVMPGIGVGYRLVSDCNAIDISTSIAGANIDNKDARGSVWTLPKINYLYYSDPREENSFYIGGGIAAGGIEKKTYQGEERTRSEFNGLIANVAVGYEFLRKERFRSFVQLDLNQPTIASRKVGEFPAPWAALAIGAGY